MYTEENMILIVINALLFYRQSKSVTSDKWRSRTLRGRLRMNFQLLLRFALRSHYLAHQTVFIGALIVRSVLMALCSAAMRMRRGELLDVDVDFAHVARPIANFPTRYVVRYVRSSDAVTVTALMFRQLALHIPVPLVNLVGLQAEKRLQLRDLRLVPDGIFLELVRQDFILLLVLSQSSLCFLGSFNLVPDDNFGHLEMVHDYRCCLRGVWVKMVLLAQLAPFRTILTRALQ